MDFDDWSAVDEPAFGQYGTWEAANPDCVAKGLSTSKNTKMIQLLFASICACQVLFMASRAPRVTWEAVYLPFVETILYGMASTGNGSMRLADGRMVPIARFCSWLITCPIMLFQVVGIHEVKIYGISCRNMVMAASLIRTVFGIGASVTIDMRMRWVQYFLSCATFFFELVCVYQIFAGGLKKFGAVKTTLNNIVYSRIQFLRFLFYLSWSSFPIVWLISSTGLCMVSEDVSVLCYLVADMICKNTYGITNANTLFRVLNGKWEAETEEDALKPKDHTRDNHVGESYIEQFFAGGNNHRTESDGAVPAAGVGRADARDIELGMHGLPAYTPENARIYTEKMHAQAHRLNKSPEQFVNDRDLPSYKDAKGWDIEFSRRRGSRTDVYDQGYPDRRPSYDDRDDRRMSQRDAYDGRGRRGSAYDRDPRDDDYAGRRGSHEMLPLPNDRESDRARDRTLSPNKGRDREDTGKDEKQGTVWSSLFRGKSAQSTGGA